MKETDRNLSGHNDQIPETDEPAVEVHLRKDDDYGERLPGDYKEAYDCLRAIVRFSSNAWSLPEKKAVRKSIRQLLEKPDDVILKKAT